MERRTWLYEVRINFADGYEIARIEAENIDRAKRIALAQEMDAISATVLCVIDRQPQQFLAW